MEAYGQCIREHFQDLCCKTERKIARYYKGLMLEIIGSRFAGGDTF